MRILQTAANTWDSHMIELAACRDVFATACKISTTIGPSIRVQPHGRKNMTKEMIHLCAGCLGNGCAVARCLYRQWRWHEVRIEQTTRAWPAVFAPYSRLDGVLATSEKGVARPGGRAEEIGSGLKLRACFQNLCEPAQSKNHDRCAAKVRIVPVGIEEQPALTTVMLNSRIQARQVRCM